MKEEYSYILDQSGITLLPPEEMTVMLNEEDETQHLVIDENEIVIPCSEDIVLSCRLCNTEFPSEDDASRHMDEHQYLGYLNDCTIDDVSIYGWVDDERTLQRFIADYTGSTGVGFVTRTSGRNKSRKVKNKDRSRGFLGQCSADENEENDRKMPDRIMFHFKSRVMPIPELPFPFTCGNYVTKDCMHGRRYQSWEEKLRKKVERETLLPLEHSDYARPNIQIQNRTMNRSIKKVACEATMYIKEIVMYPQYYLDYKGGAMKAHHVRKAKTMVMEQLKRDLALGLEVEKKTRFYVKVPLAATHNHVTGNVSLGATDIGNVSELESQKIIETVENESLQLVPETTTAGESSAVSNGVDMDFVPTILSNEVLEKVVELQQEIHVRLDKIKDVSCLCTDIGALQDCLDSMDVISSRLSETIQSEESAVQLN